ncbi:TIGR03619 family F420-dependent LLM class oxidoreductase [Trujillonella humicola]|uniref:TIGR03619 family F420-dependent LLM class oxidoreductase n=1 Tax=Trujillonella humicola TaxID=3383699 RepID=UPI0039063C69
MTAAGGSTAVGLCLPQLGGHVTRDALRAFVESAEELGFGGLWVQEHMFYPHEPVSGYAARPGLAVPEAYRTTLSSLETLSMAAAWSSRAEIGTSVLVAGYHRPVQLAQRLATLDLLSGGRLVVGFSVGWSDDEHRQADVDPRTRGRRLDEMLDALEACWGEDPVAFDGEFFSIPTSDVRPKPVQRPRPRLLSGMRSEAGLRRTAERFDIWNPASGALEDILATAEQLRERRPAGRGPLEVYWRVYTEPPVPVRGLRPLSVDELAADVARAREVGIAQVIVDANFDRTVDSPQAWAALPERLAPLLAAAR